jgi:hypothetical protein
VRDGRGMKRGGDGPFAPKGVWRKVCDGADGGRGRSGAVSGCGVPRAGGGDGGGPYLIQNGPVQLQSMGPPCFGGWVCQLVSELCLCRGCLP